MERELYFQELSTCLQREGFTILPEEDDLLPVERGGSPLNLYTVEIFCGRFRKHVLLWRQSKHMIMI